MTELEEAYRTLELEPGATPEQIRQAYRDLAKLWHPDRVSRHPQLRKRCEAKMTRINAAYDYLKGHYVAPAAAPPPPPPRARARPRPAPEPEPEPEEQEEGQDSAVRPWPQAPGYDSEVGPWIRRGKARPKAKRFPNLAELASLGTASALFLLAVLVMVWFFLSHKLHMPPDHPYYGFIRIVVFLGASYGSFFCLTRGFDELLLILLPIALMFNPIVPVSISSEDWILINVVTPLAMLAVLFEMCRREWRRR